MSATTKSAIQTASLYSLERVRELSAASTARDTLQAAEGRAVPVDASSVTRSVAQVDQLAHLAYTRAAPSTDSRYVKFVEAVRALRVDLDLSSLSRAQIDRILESAARMYLINDGIPEPVEPLPIEPVVGPDGAQARGAARSGDGDAAPPADSGTVTPADPPADARAGPDTGSQDLAPPTGPDRDAGPAPDGTDGTSDGDRAQTPSWNGGRDADGGTAPLPGTDDAAA